MHQRHIKSNAMFFIEWIPKHIRIRSSKFPDTCLHVVLIRLQECKNPREKQNHEHRESRIGFHIPVCVREIIVNIALPLGLHRFRMHVAQAINQPSDQLIVNDQRNHFCDRSQTVAQAQHSYWT